VSSQTEDPSIDLLIELPIDSVTDLSFDLLINKPSPRN